MMFFIERRVERQDLNICVTTTCQYIYIFFWSCLRDNMSHYFEGFPGNTILNLQSPLWGVLRLWMETLKNSKLFPAVSNCKTSPLSWPFHCHKGSAVVKSMAFLGLFFVALCQLTLLTICPPETISSAVCCDALLGRALLREPRHPVFSLGSATCKL